MATFGERLRALREERRISQTELAAYIGVTPSAISQYEVLKTRYPPMKILRRLAEYFDCSIDYLVGRTDHRRGTIEELQADWPDGVQMLYRAHKEATPEQKRMILAIIRSFLQQSREGRETGEEQAKE